MGLSDKQEVVGFIPLESGDIRGYGLLSEINKKGFCRTLAIFEGSWAPSPFRYICIILFTFSSIYTFYTFLSFTAKLLVFTMTMLA